MAKVIKAGFARVVEAEKSAVKVKPVPEEDIESPEETVFEPETPALTSEEDQASVRETYQAAYDDLIIAAQDEVSAMLEDARNEALKLMREAEASVNELRNQAWEEGYSNATSQARQQIEELISKANSDAASSEKNFASERERLLADLEAQMLGIALDVAGKILHKELAGDDSAYISMLKEAIERMPSEDVVTIRLNPEEYTRFFNKKEAKFQTDKGQVTAKLVPDPTLNSFDALIESPSGIVDAGADTQMTQMKRNMGL